MSGQASSEFSHVYFENTKRSLDAAVVIVRKMKEKEHKGEEYYLRCCLGRWFFVWYRQEGLNMKTLIWCADLPSRKVSFIGA
jgi:hypothetical protein